MVKRRGVTLIELMVGISVMLPLLLVIAGMSMLSTQTIGKVDRVSSDMLKTRIGIERITSDMRASDDCLSYYPTSSPTYFADRTTTLILRQPKIDASGNYVVGTYTIIVYHLEGAAGNQQLKRYTAIASDVSQPAPTLDSIVATNVSSLKFIYIAHESFQGNYGDTYTLVGTPIGSTAPFNQEIYLGGLDASSTGYAAFVGKTANFYKALLPSATADVMYQVDPQEVVKAEPANAANAIIAQIKIKHSWRAQDHLDHTDYTSFTGRAQLMNAK